MARRKAAARKKKIAVLKFASCDGCQLTLLDCEDEVLALAELVDLAYFPEASRRMIRGPYDLTIVEGSITTPHDRERIRRVRAETSLLLTIGACATAGGIQALRNFARSEPATQSVSGAPAALPGRFRGIDGFVSAVYATPEYIDTLATSTAIADHVPVDYELRGCPIDKRQLLAVITALLAGRRPSVPSHSVCVECKLRGNVCVTVAHGTPCLGPVTHAGCGALCPGFHRGCYGCFGPSAPAQTGSLVPVLRRSGMDEAEVGRAFRTFNANAPAFREEAERHGGGDPPDDRHGS